MPTYDIKCEKCEHIFEARIASAKFSAHLPECPECTSNFTKIVWLTMPSIDRAKDPYDYLDGPIPSSRKVKSFANDKRVGGKDTT